MFGNDFVVQAQYLSISENEITIIRMESSNSIHTQISNILLKWKRKVGQGATIAALRKALQQCEDDTTITVNWEAFHAATKSIGDQTRRVPSVNIRGILTRIAEFIAANF